jgi:Tfp pilus assembly protein PilO
MTDTRKWSALAVVLVAAIFAAGWFLLVSPKRGEASELRQQTGTQEEANARLADKITLLKTQQADLPEQRAKLATLRNQIPDNPALPSLIRDLTAAGRKAGVAIDAMAPAPPVALVAEVTAPVAATAGATEETADESTGESTATTPSAPTATAGQRNLFQVPLTLTVSGSYFELEQFINKLENLRRSFLVSGFTLAPQEAQGTDEAEGGLTVVLNGRVFLSQQAPATTTTPVAPTATTTGE